MHVNILQHRQGNSPCLTFALITRPKFDLVGKLGYPKTVSTPVVLAFQQFKYLTLPAKMHVAKNAANCLLIILE